MIKRSSFSSHSPSISTKIVKLLVYETIRFLCSKQQTETTSVGYIDSNQLFLLMIGLCDLSGLEVGNLPKPNTQTGNSEIIYLLYAFV